MKKLTIQPILAVLAVSLALGFSGSMTALAATTPSLGLASTYGILSGTFTNTVAGTTINGDVGFTTGPAMAPAGVHTNYGSGAPYSTAHSTDALNALTALGAQPCTYTFPAGAIDLATDVTNPNGVGVYAPGVYCSTGAMTVGAGGPFGGIKLVGSGTYIFRTLGVADALTSTLGSVVTLSGASACDVFWTPTAATTLGANSTFAGTIIDNANAITVGASTTWLGRALSLGAGTITTDTDTITVPTCLSVVKQVNGGVATPASFNLHVEQGGVDVAGSPAAGAAAPGTAYALTAGTYAVSEDANPFYTQSFSGDCSLIGNITLGLGDNKVCTVTNNFIIPATINVVKTVVNTFGGTKVVANFPLFVNGGPVVSGVANVFAAPATYAVTETGDPGYIGTFSGDCDATGHVSIVPGDAKVCILTNNDIAPVPAAPVGGGGGGSVSLASLNPPVPPLIDVVKVPSPLALPAGPGNVTYTYTLHNTGTIPLTNVTMVDNSCAPLTLVSGDTNSDSKLDVTETWIYTCKTNLTKTTTNTVTATGWANGISATDVALATVVVGAPTVPPLIHVTKVPNPLVLPAGGGMVTYTEKITTPGTVALSNVQLTDDKCAPMKFISGDTNSDSKLDPTETWTYTCSTNLTQTTTNTAVATGEANGITVRDFAIATVVVAPHAAAPVPVAPNPTFPNAGIPPVDNGNSGNMIIPAVMAFVAISLAVVLNKRKN
jgi:uncharacterized repeat protein (TIGR01451 family)